ncbi:MAG TPA: response regulator [Puia sp.]|nr:response regulator [Puia sp.]
MIQRYVVVDDDIINNELCRFVIEEVFPRADIETFTDPGKALVYIESTYIDINAPDAVVLLDINMPTLSGWEFLEAFEQFDERVKEKLKVYMLSSSVDPLDSVRAKSNKYVLDYIEKPLTSERVKILASK